MVRTLWEGRQRIPRPIGIATRGMPGICSHERPVPLARGAISSDWGATGIDDASTHKPQSGSITLKRFMATTAILLGATSVALAQGMGATSAAKKPYPTAPDYAAPHHHFPVKWHKHRHHKPALHTSNKTVGSGPQH